MFLQVQCLTTFTLEVILWQTKKKKGKKEKKREKNPKQQKKKKMLVVMDLFQTAVSAEFTMLNVLPFRKELLSSKAEELLSVFVCFFFLNTC